jgi:uncharacterized protein YijF (DUF1287 family)
LLFTNQPVFSSKNQMSSVREFAVGDFVATHFQSAAVLIGCLSRTAFKLSTEQPKMDHNIGSGTRKGLPSLRAPPAPR